MAAPVEQGDVLAGKYRVERVLGEGGMGVVVAAIDTQLERRVAIKFLLPEYAEHPDASARFMREARAAVRIQSEHIARVIDVSKLDNGSPYMVMEYLQGADLSEVLKRRGALPIEEAVDYVIQACDAIAEAHSYNIVHRDLKPANLFLAKQPDGASKVKVLDFGISKTTAGDRADVSLTRTSSMMGSPLYMSPEQMRSTRDVDWRTDIWALGVILYELLSGDMPFDATTIPSLSAKILLDPPEPFQCDVPEGLQRAIDRALAKHPDQRFPSVAEFSMAIAPFGSRNTRQTVERISRILSAAGMSTSQVEMPPSLPPASNDLDATQIDLDIPLETAGLEQDRSKTMAEWGRTNGVGERKAGIGRWLALGAVGTALIGGFAYALLVQSQPAPASVAAQPAGIEQGTVAADHTLSGRDVAATQDQSSAPDYALSPSAAGALDSTESTQVNGTANADTVDDTAHENIDENIDEKEPKPTAAVPTDSPSEAAAAPTHSQPGVQEPKPAAKPKPTAKLRPKAPKREPKTQAEPKSQRNKFGSRK